MPAPSDLLAGAAGDPWRRRAVPLCALGPPARLLRRPTLPHSPRARPPVAGLRVASPPSRCPRAALVAGTAQRQGEPAWHRRARRQRAQARVLVRLGRAANLLGRHHSAQARPMGRGGNGRGGGGSGASDDFEGMVSAAVAAALRAHRDGLGGARNLSSGARGGGGSSGFGGRGGGAASGGASGGGRQQPRGGDGRSNERTEGRGQQRRGGRQANGGSGAAGARRAAHSDVGGGEQYPARGRALGLHCMRIHRQLPRTHVVLSLRCR